MIKLFYIIILYNYIMYNLLISSIFSFLHFFICFYAIVILLLINKVDLCIFLLFILMTTKCSHYYFKKCIITPFEDNNFYPSLSEGTKSMVCSFNMNISNFEEIIINIGIFLISIKILLLSSFNYYNFNVLRLFDIFKI